MNHCSPIHIHITYHIISIYLSYLKETPKHDPFLLAGNGYLQNLLFPSTSHLLALRPGLRVRPPSSETERDSCDSVPYHVFIFIIAGFYHLYSICNISLSLSIGFHIISPHFMSSHIKPYHVVSCTMIFYHRIITYAPCI